MAMQPIEIVSFNRDDRSFRFNQRAVETILSQVDIEDRYVSIVTVAGAFRKGKSFLLNFLIKYMNHVYNLNADETNWLKLSDRLTGFDSQGGSDRITNGILMWPETFKTELLSGEKVAVILLDTQGTYEHGSDMKEWNTIFTFSTMISSHLIYNLQGNVSEDDLQKLQYFIEYGKFALNDNNHEAPFQKLHFLVRDWQFDYDQPYGEDGGEEILERCLSAHGPRAKAVRESIKNCFTGIKCFLMPHPGSRVVRCKNFQGTINEVDETFREYIKIFVSKVLAPENLVLKKIGGRKLQCHELPQYWANYFESLNSEELPNPRNLYNSTVQLFNNNLREKTVTKYKDGMNSFLEDCKNLLFIENDLYSPVPKIMKLEALRWFAQQKVMGSEADILLFRQQLQEDLDREFRSSYKFEFDKMEYNSSLATYMYTGIAAGSAVLSRFSGPVGGVLGAIGVTIAAKQKYDSSEMKEKYRELFLRHGYEI